MYNTKFETNVRARNGSNNCEMMKTAAKLQNRAYDVHEMCTIMVYFVFKVKVRLPVSGYSSTYKYQPAARNCLDGKAEVRPWRFFPTALKGASPARLGWMEKRFGI